MILKSKSIEDEDFHLSNISINVCSIFVGLQKQMLFMRCAFESRQEKLNLYPFPGLKIINIRGSALLALDLIIIGSFVTRLADQHRLLELALRDYPLDRRGLVGLLPCIPLVRTVTICLRRLIEPECYYMLGMLIEILYEMIISFKLSLVYELVYNKQFYLFSQSSHRRKIENTRIIFAWTSAVWMWIRNRRWWTSRRCVRKSC